MNNKVFSCLIIGIIFCTSLNAQTKHEGDGGTATDSTFTFYYPSCIQMFKANYKSNRQTLQLLKKQLRTFAKGKDTLYVNGYSGECENDSRNLRTAYHRCNNLKGFLINQYGLRERDFKTVNIPHNHPGLGDIVLVSYYPFAGQQVEEAIRKVEPEKKEVTQTCVPAMEPGQERMEQKQPEKQTAKEEPATSQVEQQPEQIAVLTSENTSSTGRYLGVKTNLAAWAGTILNIAADVQVGKHISVELPLLWCPWYVGSKHAVKTFTIQPEARYWLSKPGEGHFFGVHAHVGWFNVKWNRDRYQDTDRPLLGAGISYGYLLPFNERWAAEFTLGAGYANMRYDTYYNIDNGARIDTRTKNYWGITRVGLSVVYRFNLKK